MQTETPQSHDRACPMDSSEEPSKIRYQHKSLSPATDADKLDQKRRQLLIRSAKRPFKRSRLVRQKCCQEGKGETDTISTASLSLSNCSSCPISATRTRSPISKRRKRNASRRLNTTKQRVVSFDTKYNQTILVPSHRDLDRFERRAYYFQRDEYVRIKRNIQQTIEFLKSPIDYSSSFNPFHDAQSFAPKAREEHCVRGLECLAEEAVNDFKKRIQKTSKTAVFRFQEKRKRRIVDNVMSVNSSHQVALAEEYRKYTAQCEQIARRWGKFDAMDAGYDPASSSSIAVNCGNAQSQAKDNSSIADAMTVEHPVDFNASLSSLSYDGDDGEDEKEGSDDLNAGDRDNAFDSLPEGLFNF